MKIVPGQALGQGPELPKELAMKETQRLYTYLMRNYNKNFKPFGPILVQFAFDLIQIVNVIEKDQVIVVHASINHYWTDFRLKWDPRNYSGIPLIQMPYDKVWT